MRKWTEFWAEEDGAGVVEVVLIIGLVILFKNKVTTLVTDIFTTIKTRSAKV